MHLGIAFFAHFEQLNVKDREKSSIQHNNSVRLPICLALSFWFSDPMNESSDSIK